MKTFTKTVSMILIAVMCLSLFASGAYAMGDFSLDGSGIDSNFNVGASAPSASASFGNDSGFSLSDNFVSAASNGGTSVAQTTDTTDGEPKSDDFNLGDETNQTKDTTKDVDASMLLMSKGSMSLMSVAPSDNSWKFSNTPTSIKVTATDADATVTITKSGGTGELDADSFKRITYSTSSSGENRQNVPAAGFAIEAGQITIQGSWLKTLTPGQTYYFYGERTDELPMKLGYVAVNAGTPGDYGTFTVSPSSFKQYDDTAVAIAVTAGNASQWTNFSRFAVIPQGSSSGGSYVDGNYTISGTTLTFDKSFLNGLRAGVYDIYGIATNGQQVKLGTMTILAGSGGAGSQDWYLWPDYDIPWTSGDDPLMFRSNLMALRQTYPRYTIVPRYGYGAGSIPNNMIDVNQFWDMGDGVFALGTNFLRSLPAGTYTLQVVDYKHLADCTNVVTFRIGSTLRPIDTDKHVIGSIKNLRFLCDEPVYEVYVGNIPLTYGEDYALSNGNKTITLSFEFLNKRSAGNTYTIKALTYSGTYPSTTFQILSTAQGSASPRTGDESNLGLWAAFLLLSGAAVVVLVPKLRKHDF